MTSVDHYIRTVQSKRRFAETREPEPWRTRLIRRIGEGMLCGDGDDHDEDLRKVLEGESR